MIYEYLHAEKSLKIKDMGLETHALTPTHTEIVKKTKQLCATSLSYILFINFAFSYSQYQEKRMDVKRNVHPYFKGKYFIGRSTFGHRKLF
jgi:hypothetical protein